MNIKAEKIHLKYGKHLALQDVNFELRGEKIYGLLGRNGAGKTSLLSILASFREQTSGSLTINGETPFENAKIMQQVAFLYNEDYKDQSDNVIEVLKDAENYRPHFDMDYALHLVDRFKLDKKKPIKKFSKGMQSALNVVLGLATRAPVTIFDEVYLGMDSPSRDIFYKELLEDQQNHPRIIILSTHLVSEMDYLFDEVLILHHGQMILHEAFDDLVSKGATITGHRDVVDSFVQSKKQIHSESLGGTKSVMIFGELSESERKEAAEQGLAIESVSLHHLFLHLTEEDM